MSNETSLANALRDLRSSLGWTLKEAEQASGVPFSYLSAIENERRGAGPDTLRKLAEAYTDSRAEAEDLLKKLTEVKEEGKDTLFHSASRGPFQNPRFLKAILFPADAIIHGKKPRPEQIEVVEEDPGFTVDLKAGSLTRTAIVRLDDRTYSIRIEVSEADDQESRS